MRVSVGCATEKGNYRSKNQDRIMCSSYKVGEGFVAIACVCDGIGSFAQSEIASQMLVGGVEKWFQGIKNFYPIVINREELVDDLELTLRELNELIWEYGRENHMELGCTMSLLLLIDLEYYIFHVGDSRIYRLREKLFQLTRDEVVLKHFKGKSKTFLLNYIGKNRILTISRMGGHAARGDVYILSTDGLNKKLILEDVRELPFLTGTDEVMVQECLRLIQTVLERGERDNISCGIIQLS